MHTQPDFRGFVEYDANGNLTNGAGAGYTWDAADRLVGIRHSDGGQTRFTYDGSARLREMAEYGPSTNLTNIVRYAWNGWLPWAELDGSNGIVKTFTWGLDVSGTVGGAGGIGGLLGIRSRLGTPTNYYVRTDGKGNVTEIRQSNAITVATYSYAPFGSIISNTGAFTQPFSFQTKLFHARSGLAYFGYRYYSPQFGRWLSREPLGEGASINLYAYCANNPINFVDPLGLRDVDVYVWRWQGVGIGNGRVGHVMISEHNSEVVLLSQFPLQPRHLFSANTPYDFRQTFRAEDTTPEVFVVHVPDDAAFDSEVSKQKRKKTWAAKPMTANQTHCTRAAYDALKAGGVPVFGEDTGQLLPGTLGDELNQLSNIQAPGADWWVTLRPHR